MEEKENDRNKKLNYEKLSDNAEVKNKIHIFKIKKDKGK